MDQSRLARVAATLTADAPAVLDRLLRLGVQVLSVTGATVAVVGDGQHRGAVAASAPDAAVLDDLQFSLGEGPGLDADRSERPVLEPDLEAAVAQWPAFAPAALAHGARAAFAFPLRIGAVRVGVLSLHRDAPGDLDAVDVSDAVAFAHIACHLMLELQADTAPDGLPDRLEEILDHRAHVHQATGMIAAQLGIDVTGALRRLRALAWSVDRSIDDVALEVVARTLRFDEA